MESERPTRAEVLALTDAVRDLSESVREMKEKLRPPGPPPQPEEVEAALARASRAAALGRESG